MARNKKPVEEQLSEQMADYLVEQRENNADVKPLCKYCTENYVLARGRGIRQQLIPITPNYCPMCGRKLLPTDRNY